MRDGANRRCFGHQGRAFERVHLALDRGDQLAVRHVSQPTADVCLEIWKNLVRLFKVEAIIIVVLTDRVGFGHQSRVRLNGRSGVTRHRRCVWSCLVLILLRQRLRRDDLLKHNVGLI